MNPFKVDMLNGWQNTIKEDRLHVVMLYEDLAMGRQARNLFATVEDEFADAKGFDYELWRTDVLRAADSYVITASKAANADMVVVAVHLPALAKDLWKWLDIWVAEARADTALVVLFDRQHGREQVQVLKGQLEELIGSRPITIFVESVVVEGTSLPAPDAKERAVIGTILPIAQVYARASDDSPKTLSTSSWSRWGINE